MRYSTRTRYGLRLLLNLARREPQSQVQLADIASDEDISIKYLEKIVRPLIKEGFLAATRGAKGGYALALSPDRIFLDKVFNCLEGKSSCVPCLDGEESCARKNRCSSIGLWRDLDQQVSEFLSKISLETLLDDSKEEAWSWII